MLLRFLKITLTSVENSFNILFLQMTNCANKAKIKSKNRPHSQIIHSKCSLFLKSLQNPRKINVKEFAVSKVVGARLATLLKKLLHKYFGNMVGKYLWWSSVLVKLQTSRLQLYWKWTLWQELSKDFAKTMNYFPSFLKFSNSYIQGTPHSGRFWYSQTNTFKLEKILWLRWNKENASSTWIRRNL